MQTKILRLDNENKTLKNEIQLLRDFIKTNFKSSELLATSISGQKTDQMTREALKKCFLEKPLVVMIFASPLAMKISENKRKEVMLIDYNKEFEGVREGLKRTGNAVQVK